MGQTFRLAAIATLAISLALPAFAQTEPPGRVARLAFTEGTVSFHDDDQSGWTRATINTPLTSGDSIWNEAGARSEISLAGTRVRLDGATQLNLLTVDDTLTDLQLAQGRMDIKTFTWDPETTYTINTPRGLITLQQQGDYYVEAGSTQDATRLGVRSGAAQIQSTNGQVLAVRAGEVGEILGDAGKPQLRTVKSAPPPMPAQWAQRDRTVVYDEPQYLNYGVTGYEDLNAHGSWDNDPEYGRVWSPRNTPADWAPYRTGRWQYVKPWGWTWVDEQPWGFAPYHYGRWANRNNRWVWVPPQRDVRPVYAPALVAFIGGIELSVSLGQQNRAPVGWFPLAPREVYVPSYTTDRDYYRRLNRQARIDDRIMEERWERAQRRDDRTNQSPLQALINQRFAIVVPSEDFVRSRPMARAAIRVAPERIAAAPVAPVSAPPAPTQSVATTPAPQPQATPGAPAPGARMPGAATPGTTPPAAQTPQRPSAPGTGPAAAARVTAAPTTQTQVGGMATLGKPTETDRPKTAGPKVATQPTGDQNRRPDQARDRNQNRDNNQATRDQRDRRTPPALQPRVGAPPPKIDGPVTAAPTTSTAPGGTPATPAAPATPAQPGTASPATPATPATPPTQAQPRTPAAPPAQATTPPGTPPATAPQQGRREQDQDNNRGQRDRTPPTQAAPATPPATPSAPPRPTTATPATPPATPPVAQQPPAATPATPPTAPAQAPRDRETRDNTRPALPPQQATPPAQPPQAQPQPPRPDQQGRRNREETTPQRQATSPAPPQQPAQRPAAPPQPRPQQATPPAAQPAAQEASPPATPQQQERNRREEERRRGG